MAGLKEKKRAFGKQKEKQAPELTMSQQVKIVQPRRQDGIFMLKSDFERIKTMVKRIKKSNSVFNSVGFTFLGVACTAFITALTLPVVEESSRVICWAVFAVSIIVATLALYFSHARSKELKNSKDSVLEELEYLEERYKG